MYPNLKAELARIGMTVWELSAKTGLSYSNLVMKIREGKDFSVEDAQLIADVIGCDLPISYLFQKKDKVTS